MCLRELREGNNMDPGCGVCTVAHAYVYVVWQQASRNEASLALASRAMGRAARPKPTVRRPAFPQARRLVKMKTKATYQQFDVCIKEQTENNSL